MGFSGTTAMLCGRLSGKLLDDPRRSARSSAPAASPVTYKEDPAQWRVGNSRRRSYSAAMADEMDFAPTRRAASSSACFTRLWMTGEGEPSVKSRPDA